MDKNRLYFEVAVFLACLVYLLESLKVPLGTPTRPGPGFFPILVAAVAVAVSFGLALGTFLKLKKAGQASGGQAGAGDNLVTIGWYILALVAFIAAFELLGTLAGIFLLTLVTAKVCGMKGYLFPPLLGLAAATFIYLVFVVWFRMPLPPGLIRLPF